MGKRPQIDLIISVYAVITTGDPSVIMSMRAQKSESDQDGKFDDENTPNKTILQLMTNLQVGKIREYRQRRNCDHTASLLASLLSYMLEIKHFGVVPGFLYT